MEIMKPFKVTPRGDWYRIKGPAELDQKLLDSINWPKEKPFINFVFAPQKMDAAKVLRFKLSRKYLASINCVAGGRGVKVPAKPATLAGIEVRPPKDLAELKRLNRMDHARLLKEEGKKAGYSAWNDYKLYENEIMPKAKALVFYRKGKFAGLAVHFKSDIPVLGCVDHLGWHSAFKKFTPAERRSAEYQQALWMKKTATHGLSVLLDSVPGPYYKFIAGLGLYAARVRVERM